MIYPYGNLIFVFHRQHEVRYSNFFLGQLFVLEIGESSSWLPLSGGHLKFTDAGQRAR